MTLGLPDDIRALLFDLDGVLTHTAAVHAEAWARTFDELLSGHAEATGTPFEPFDPVADYGAHVDGKQRADGVRDFLRSRGIDLPEGEPGDDPSAETVNGVGNRKNELVLQLIDSEGVEVFAGSLRYLRAAADAGLRRALVSSSANARLVLEVTGLSEYIEEVVDGVVAREEGLPGKPAPDTFLLAAERLGVAPEHAAVVEDALVGVAAGAAGGFGYVIGVDRLDQAEALAAQGADIVVADLEELL